MPLGWIDFSKSERTKVLSVLDALQEPGTLDELGIAPIRDGFSELFFPGISTIQTRAKYFLIVPYAFMELELGAETDSAKIKQRLDEIEYQCAKDLLKDDDDNGNSKDNAKDKVTHDGTRHSIQKPPQPAMKTLRAPISPT